MTQELKFKLRSKLIVLLISVTGIALLMMGLINFNSVYQTILKNKIEQLTFLGDLKAEKIRDFYELLEKDSPLFRFLI